MAQREIVLDTETTGFSYNGGDRVIEIGCVELVDNVVTGEHFHTYVNPNRSVPYASIAIHGIDDRRLIGEPRFKEVADKLIDFLGDSTVIMHNARFDVSFLNMEFAKVSGCDYQIKNDKVIDTVTMAKRFYPGSKCSLDALCKRFSISLRDRKVHGALCDATLLSKVYISMIAGEQLDCFSANSENKILLTKRKSFEKRDFCISPEEDDSHKKFIVGNIKSSLWYSDN